MGAVPHDVGIGDDAIARDEETGARRGGLSSGPPRFGIVGLHALNNELCILCVRLVEKEREVRPLQWINDFGCKIDGLLSRLWMQCNACTHMPVFTCKILVKDTQMITWKSQT